MKRLSAGSIATYKLFRKAFLDEYRPPLKIIKQIEAIRNFKQAPNEPLHCSWERFTESLFSCPEHKLNEHEQLRIFYQGLDVETRRKVDFKGPIPRMTPTKGMEAIKELSAHSLLWSKEENVKSENKELQVETDIQEKKQKESQKQLIQARNGKDKVKEQAIFWDTIKEEPHASHRDFQRSLYDEVPERPEYVG
ncbi:integrase, catalytic region, zinc finger, CCHC-type containing protein [Tanacetum coccineum]